MRWAVNLYTTEKTKRKLPRLMRKIRRSRLQPGVWLITLASNPENLLDIFQGIYYMQPVFQKQNPDIVGIAEDEDAAKELTVQILQDVYEKNGNFNVRSYFEFRE